MKFTKKAEFNPLERAKLNTVAVNLFKSSVPQTSSNTYLKTAFSFHATWHRNPKALQYLRTTTPVVHRSGSWRRP